ncbi:MAG: family 16 glycoside hydrolase [Armatimonadota bacterium]
MDHTYESWIGNHQDYEDFADGKGDDDRYHAKSNGEYHPQWTASQFVVSAATQNHKRQYFDWVENEPLNWNAALKAGLPIAERHTAGLIARFMQQAGVPPKAPPLSGYVYRKGGGRVAGAYIFYRKDGDKGPWDYCQADRDGRYVLPVQPGIKYWIRPAMPDYMFEGWGEFQKESPVSYTQDPGVTSATRRDFYLNPRPNRVAVIAGIDKGPTAGPLAVLRPATRDLAALLIQPRGTSKDDPNYISPTLARDATDAMMDVQSNHYVLGVENGGTGLAEQAYVTVQLRRLIVVATGRIADSPDQIVTAIGQARDLTTKAATRAPISAQTWESVKRNLPRRQVPGPDGKQREVIVLPGIHGADAPVESLLDYGLIPVPSLAGAEIEVRVTPGRGYVGPAAGEPLRLKTDGRGAAQFIVKAGNQAGRLRLALRVTKHPAAARIKPRATIDLLVQPALKGPDPATVQPPTFQPALAMMTIAATIIEPGPTAVRAKPDVYRTHVSIDGSQLRARMLGQVAARPGLGQITEIATPQEPATERPEDWQLIGDARLTTEAGRRALVTNGFAFGALRTEDLTSFTLRFRYRHAEGIADVALRTKIANPPPYLYHVLLANNGVSVSRDEHQQQKELQTVPYTLRPGEWYDFTISVTRETIQVTINGTQVISATDPQPLPAGVLALGSLIGNGFAYSNVVLERR